MTDELDDSARDFIARALREEARANPVMLARIRKRVLTSVFVVSSAGGTAQAAGALGKTWLLAVSTPVAKTLLVGSLAVGGAATLAVTLPQRGSERPPASASPVKRSAPERSARAVPVVPPREVAVPAPLPEVAAPVPAPSAAPPVPTTAEPQVLSGAVREPSVATSLPVENRRPSLAEELAVLKQAQARLNAGDGKGALRLLDETAVAHGAGQLAVERAAVEILAACQAGEVQRADRLARAFLAAHPDVPAAARVRASCAGEGR
jgi:hypothetical protein